MPIIEGTGAATTRSSGARTTPPPDAALFEAEVRATRPEPPARAESGGGGAAARDVTLDLTQLALDVAGIFDPTPVSDGANGLISLARGDLTGALISGVSMVPYIGDTTKLAKLERLGGTLDRVADLVRASPDAAAALRGPLEELRGLLDRAPIDSLPDAVREPVQALEEKLDEALDAVDQAEAAPVEALARGGAPSPAGSAGEPSGPSGPNGPDRPVEAAAGDRAPEPTRDAAPAAGEGAEAGQAAVTGSPRPGPGETLVGSSRSQMRHAAARIIASDPDHPLRFLLRDRTILPGRPGFHRQIGLRHEQLADRPEIVQMGHIQSNKLGGNERIMLQGAWENQYNNLSIEKSQLGGAVLDQAAVDIGGIAVDLQTARFWETWGLLPPGTVNAAPRVIFG